MGDMFQLAPVMDRFIFEGLKGEYGPLATNLWKDNNLSGGFDAL